MIDTSSDITANLNSKTGFLQKLKEIAFEFIELQKNSVGSLTHDEHQELIELSKDKTIVITRADKCIAVVIHDLNDYIDKISKIIYVDGKFKLLNETRKINS